MVEGCGPHERRVEEEAANPEAQTDREIPAGRPKSPVKQRATEGIADATAQPRRGTSPPQTADEAVRAVLRGLRENNPRAVWQFLPTGYQKDVNDLVHEFADRMDPELWNGAFTSLKKVVRLLKTQKRFILGNPKLNAAESVNVEDLEANWDGLVGLVETLAESDLSDVGQLKRLDVGEVLQNTGGRLMEQLAALSRLHPENPFQRDVVQKLSDVDVTLVSSDGETARVRLHAPDSGEPPQESEFIKVEGKWIPRTLAEQWDANLAAAQARLKQLTPEKVSQLKGQMRPILGTIDATVDRLQGATTQAEFDAVVQQQVYPMIERMASSIQPPTVEPGDVENVPASSKGDGATGPVTVIVMGRLDANREETLSRLLRSRSDDPGNEILIGPEISGGRLEYRLVPVGDIDAFAAKLDFAEVVEMDREGRTVTIQLRGPLKEPDGGP